MTDELPTNVTPLRPLDEAAALAWLRSQPGGRTNLPAAELARRWGWQRYNVTRRLQRWRKDGLVVQRGRALIAVDTPFRPKEKRFHCVYVVKSEPGPVKIGKAVNPHRRLKELKTTSPSPLLLEYIGECGTESASDRIEKRAQHIVRTKRAIGEWFDVSTAEAVAAIEKAAGELGLELRRREVRFVVSVKIDHDLQRDLIAAGFLRSDDRTLRGVVDALKKSVQR